MTCITVRMFAMLLPVVRKTLFYAMFIDTGHRLALPQWNACHVAVFCFHLQNHRAIAGSRKQENKGAKRRGADNTP